MHPARNAAGSGNSSRFQLYPVQPLPYFAIDVDQVPIHVEHALTENGMPSAEIV